MRIKENKKPAVEVFAAVRELTTEQRESAQRVVVEGQRALHRILDRASVPGAEIPADE